MKALGLRCRAPAKIYEITQKVAVMERVSPLRKVLFRKVLCLFVGCVALAGSTQAQPWPRAEGELFTSPSFSVYSTVRQTNSDGSVSGIPNGGRFTGYRLGVYFEYGLTPRWTVQGLLNSSYETFSDANVRQRNLSPGDQLLGVRYALLDGSWAASLGGTVGVPWLYSLDHRPLPGYGQYSAQLNGAIGRGVSFAGNNGWSLFKAGYRRYFGGASDQLRGQLLLGLRFTQRWGLLTQLNGTLALQKGRFRLNQDLSNPNVQSGYSVLKANASVMYEYSPRATVQIGLYREVVGADSGLGGGGIVSLWYRY